MAMSRTEWLISKFQKENEKLALEGRQPLDFNAWLETKAELYYAECKQASESRMKTSVRITALERSLKEILKRIPYTTESEGETTCVCCGQTWDTGKEELHKLTCPVIYALFTGARDAEAD